LAFAVLASPPADACSAGLYGNDKCRYAQCKKYEKSCFHNPETRTWIKGVIKTEMIGKAGAYGWMNDFGEALPFAGKIHGGDPAAWHNRYPEEWARVYLPMP